MTSADLPQLRVAWATVPKAGSRLDENEDAAAWSETAGRFAVSDGATESIYSREWARILADAYVAGELASPDGALARLAATWADRLPPASDVPWYVAEKARSGAHATLVGLTLHPDGSFRADAVGDACLFLEHGGTVTSFPLGTVQEFGSTPDLLRSVAIDVDLVVRAWRTWEGAWVSGDLFVLASDAVAAYLIAACCDDRRSLRSALGLGVSRLRRRRHLRRLRGSGAIRNDDLTYVAVTVP